MNIGNIRIDNNVFLAPMAGITDMPFRILCKEKGCGMAYTEMVSAKGLFYNSERTWDLLKINKEEHPIGVQIFGSDADIISKIVIKLCETDVDIIDINMGCPAPKIVKNCEGSALLKKPEKLKEIVGAAVKVSSKPITVKIRKGWDDDSVNCVEIAKIIEGEGAQAVTVHGRTRQQFYSGKADWDIIRQVKDTVSVPVIGNGDIVDPEDAKCMFDTTGCDAVMIGRGAQGNPWIFERVVHYLSTGEIIPPPTPGEKIEMAILHTDMMADFRGENVAVMEMRKHIAWYLKGLKNSSIIKAKINNAQSIGQMHFILNEYLNYLQH